MCLVLLRLGHGLASIIIIIIHAKIKVTISQMLQGHCTKTKVTRLQLYRAQSSLIVSDYRRTMFSTAAFYLSSERRNRRFDIALGQLRIISHSFCTPLTHQFFRKARWSVTASEVTTLWRDRCAYILLGRPTIVEGFVFCRCTISSLLETAERTHAQSISKVKSSQVNAIDGRKLF